MKLLLLTNYPLLLDFIKAEMHKIYIIVRKMAGLEIEWLRNLLADMMVWATSSPRYPYIVIISSYY